MVGVDQPMADVISGILPATTMGDSGSVCLDRLEQKPPEIDAECLGNPQQNIDRRCALSLLHPAQHRAVHPRLGLLALSLPVAFCMAPISVTCDDSAS